MEDILSVMETVYKDWLASKGKGDKKYIKERKNYRKGIINRGLKWSQEYSWDIICKQWIQLFDELYNKKEIVNINNNVSGEIV
jgi:hypothetical protein